MLDVKLMPWVLFLYTFLTVELSLTSDYSASFDTYLHQNIQIHLCPKDNPDGIRLFLPTPAQKFCSSGVLHYSHNDNIRLAEGNTHLMLNLMENDSVVAQEFNSTNSIELYTSSIGTTIVLWTLAKVLAS